MVRPGPPPHRRIVPSHVIPAAPSEYPARANPCLRLRYLARALRVLFALAFWIASTSSDLLIRDRPEISSFFATSIRCSLLAFASTPPAVFAFVSRPPAALASLGPFFAFGSQWSPVFSNECFTAANAVRCARSPSPYSSTAESCVLAYVSCAFFGDRLSVLGMSLRAGMINLLTAVYPLACPVRPPLKRALCAP